MGKWFGKGAGERVGKGLGNGFLASRLSIDMILLVQELLTEHNGGQHMDLDPQNINKVAHNVLKYAIAPQLVASAGRTLPQSPA